jgi:multidrug transporter EmrE-like cation transporter
MIDFIWPMALIVLSNTVYQICSKSIAPDVHPLASVAMTYVVGAAAATVLYIVLSKGGNILKEFSHLNWASYVLGLVVIGLEVGFLFAYRAGWQVNTAATVQGAFLAISLIIVGYVLFKEPVNASKLIGVAFCLLGLFFINR